MEGRGVSGGSRSWHRLPRPVGSPSRLVLVASRAERKGNPFAPPHPPPRSLPSLLAWDVWETRQWIWTAETVIAVGSTCRRCLAFQACPVRSREGIHFGGCRQPGDRHALHELGSGRARLPPSRRPVHHVQARQEPRPTGFMASEQVRKVQDASQGAPKQRSSGRTLTHE